MTNILQVISPSLLNEMIDQGYIRRQFHPTEPLAILNYTNKTMFDQVWNEATKRSRGLIYNFQTGEIVSRPFEKFFNWGQLPEEDREKRVNDLVEVTQKFDGSLGILYGLHTGESAIATRGSFTSPQAEHATKVLRERYPTFEPILGLTYLFEIIYPENRVVVNYGQMDDLVLLAVLDTETGQQVRPWGQYDWPGPVSTPLIFQSMAKVLESPQFSNEEGFVLRFDDDLRVKIKFDEYVRLHKILTNTSTIGVWEALAFGGGIEQFIDHVPDEFYEWVHKVVHDLQGRFDKIEQTAREDFEWVMKRVRRPEIDVKKRRKEFALLANTTEYPALLFGLYDEKDISERIWKLLRPEHERPFRKDEDCL